VNGPVSDRVNGPAGRTPAEWADQAAEAVRALNHATIQVDDARGYRFPADADQTLANLQVLIDRLPQALQQLGAWLERQARAGMVRHDATPTEAGRVVAAQHALAAALTAVEDLATAGAWLAAAAGPLNRARTQTNHLAAFLEDLPDDDPDDDLDDQAHEHDKDDVVGRWSGQVPLPAEWDGVTDAQDACAEAGWDDVLGIPAVCHRRTGHPGRHMSAWVTSFAERPPAIFCAWPGTTPPTPDHLRDVDPAGSDADAADEDGAR